MKRIKNNFNRNLFKIWLYFFVLFEISALPAFAKTTQEATTLQPALECYDSFRTPQKCMPESINAAYRLEIEATNTCGKHGGSTFCTPTMSAVQRKCEICSYSDHDSLLLNDLHDPQNPTWWQSQTMFEGLRNSNHVNLTLHLGKSYDITNVRILFWSPLPESFAIYKRTTQTGEWTPYQYYSKTCLDTYGVRDSPVIRKGEGEAIALCTSKYGDISPLYNDGIVFSTLEGRSSGNFERSTELQKWVTATDIRITLNRLSIDADQIYFNTENLKSYFYAISDIVVEARCKCNGHASKCVEISRQWEERTLVCQCQHNTDGTDCQKCLPLYNDVKWKRATSIDVNECKACNCNGYADKCFYDAHLFNLTGHGGHCMDCRENRDGPNCESCRKYYFMNEDGDCISEHYKDYLYMKKDVPSINCNCNLTGCAINVLYVFICYNLIKSYILFA